MHFEAVLDSTSWWGQTIHSARKFHSPSVLPLLPYAFVLVLCSKISVALAWNAVDILLMFEIKFCWTKLTVYHAYRKILFRWLTHSVSQSLIRSLFLPHSLTHSASTSCSHSEPKTGTNKRDSQIRGAASGWQIGMGRCDGRAGCWRKRPNERTTNIRVRSFNVHKTHC